MQGVLVVHKLVFTMSVRARCFAFSVVTPHDYKVDDRPCVNLRPLTLPPIAAFLAAEKKDKWRGRFRNKGESCCTYRPFLVLPF
jgi:hypothetical protein